MKNVDLQDSSEVKESSLHVILNAHTAFSLCVSDWYKGMQSDNGLAQLYVIYTKLTKSKTSNKTSASASHIFFLCSYVVEKGLIFDQQNHNVNLVLQSHITKPVQPVHGIIRSG